MDLQTSFNNEVVSTSLNTFSYTNAGSKSSDSLTPCSSSKVHDGINIDISCSSLDNDCNKEDLNLNIDKEKSLSPKDSFKMTFEKHASKQKIRYSENGEIYPSSGAKDLFRESSPFDQMSTDHKPRDGTMELSMPRNYEDEFPLPNYSSQTPSLNNEASNDFEDNESIDRSNSPCVSEDNCSMSGYYDDDEDLERFCQQEISSMKKTELASETLEVNSNSITSLTPSEEIHETPLSKYVLGDVEPTEDLFNRYEPGDGSLLLNISRRERTKFLLSYDSTNALSISNESSNARDSNSLDLSKPSYTANSENFRTSYNNNNENNWGQFCQQGMITKEKMEFEAKIKNVGLNTSITSTEDVGTPTAKFLFRDLDATESLFTWPEIGSVDTQSRGPLNEHDLLMQVRGFFLKNPMDPKNKSIDNYISSENSTDELPQQQGSTLDEIEMVSVRNGLERDTQIKRESCEPDSNLNELRQRYDPTENKIEMVPIKARVEHHTEMKQESSEPGSYVRRLMKLHERRPFSIILKLLMCYMSYNTYSY